jgi:hypothetical protein
VAVAHEEGGAVYEITLYGAPPANLTAIFPGVTLHSEPAATILSRRVTDAAEVEGIIERLRSLGIAPLEVRASSRHCDFRIEGRLGRSVLRYLQWPFRLERERTVLRVEAEPRELRAILEHLASSGVQIDRCVRCKAA